MLSQFDKEITGLEPMLIREPGYVWDDLLD